MLAIRCPRPRNEIHSSTCEPKDQARQKQTHSREREIPPARPFHLAINLPRSEGTATNTPQCRRQRRPHRGAGLAAHVLRPCLQSSCFASLKAPSVGTCGPRVGPRESVPNQSGSSLFQAFALPLVKVAIVVVIHTVNSGLLEDDSPNTAVGVSTAVLVKKRKIV